MVSRVVTPSDTLAGTDFASSQKLTHETMTSMQHGMQYWMRQYENSRLNTKSTRRQLYEPAVQPQRTHHHHGLPLQFSMVEERQQKKKKELIYSQTCTLVQETGGNDWLILEVWVDMVRRVVTPSATLAGTELASSQKLTHETMTSMQQGTQYWIKQNENSLLKMKSTRRQLQVPA